MNAVYRVDGTTAHSSEYAGGPWHPDHQHGGAPASLICWAAERLPTLAPMMVARLTIDLLRPVPLAPLQIQAEVVREGRKIQVCAVTLLHENVAVVRASVLKIRVGDGMSEVATEDRITLPGPEAGYEPELNNRSNEFIRGLSMRVVQGEFRSQGPAAIWFKANRPIIEGEPISPLMRAAMTADFCNGTSTMVDFRHWTFINADLTVSLARLPVGEWILLDAQTWLGHGGSGIAFARLGDERGYFGRAIQSLVIDRREEPPADNR